MKVLFIYVTKSILNFSDARTLIDHARVEAQNHRFTFDEVI